MSELGICWSYLQSAGYASAMTLIAPHSSIPFEQKLKPTGSEVACSFLLAKIAQWGGKNPLKGV